MTAPSILIIEDDRRIATTLQIRLKAAGFDVHHALTGHAGLEQCAAISPSLVVLDIRLPDIDGYEVCERIRQTPGLDSTKVLFLSANSQPEASIRAEEVGGDMFLPKTCGWKELIGAIHALLGNRPVQASGISRRDSRHHKECNDV